MLFRSIWEWSRFCWRPRYAAFWRSGWCGGFACIAECRIQRRRLRLRCSQDTEFPVSRNSMRQRVATHVITRAIVAAWGFIAGYRSPRLLLKRSTPACRTLRLKHRQQAQDGLHWLPTLPAICKAARPRRVKCCAWSRYEQLLRSLEGAITHSGSCCASAKRNFERFALCFYDPQDASLGPGYDWLIHAFRI